MSVRTLSQVGIGFAQRRALTALQVAALKKDGRHWVAPSLYLNISKGRAPVAGSFAIAARHHQWMGGREAGQDPIAAKREVQVQRKIEMKPKVPTFAECASKYIASPKSGWKNPKHAQQWPSTIEMYVNPFIGKLPVDQVAVEDVLKVLKPIWTRKPETASRVRGRIEQILGWATAMGYRSGENPAQWKGGALPHLLPATGKIAKVEHRKAVPYNDVPKLTAELRTNGSISAKDLMFTILTRCPHDGTREATHAEIDREAKVWTIAAGRMKVGREHRVPLTDEALELIDSDPADSEYLFPSPSGYALSNMAMLQLLRGLRDDGSTVHGFHSSFRDWAAEQTDFMREVVEACLAHAMGDAAELAYKRTDFLERRPQCAQAVLVRRSRERRCANEDSPTSLLASGRGDPRHLQFVLMGFEVPGGCVRWQRQANIGWPDGKRPLTNVMAHSLRLQGRGLRCAF